MSAPRITWEEYALSLAWTASLRSEDVAAQPDGTLVPRRVGACALNHENKVLGCGYNGLAPGRNAPPAFWKDRDARRPYMLHAEVNLFSLFSVGEARLVAVTLMPCSSCARMIASYRVPRVVYLEEYSDSEEAKRIFEFYGISYQQMSLPAVLRDSLVSTASEGP